MSYKVSHTHNIISGIRLEFLDGVQSPCFQTSDTDDSSETTVAIDNYEDIRHISVRTPGYHYVGFKFYTDDQNTLA